MPIQIASQEVEQKMKQLLPDSGYDPAHTSLEEQTYIRNHMLPLMDVSLKQALLHMHLMADYLPERIFLPREGDSYFNQPARYTPMSFHAHEYYEAFLLARGSCMHFIGSHTLSMSAGDLVLIPPGVRHMPALLTDSCTAYSIGLRSSTVLQTMYHLIQADTCAGRFFTDTCRAQAKDGYLLYHCSEHKKYLSVLWALARELPEGPDTNPKLFFSYRTSLLELAFLRLEQRVTPEICIETGDHTPAQKMIRYMETHFSTVTKEELSLIFAYSERQISRLIRAETGFTFREYLTDIRIRYICDMLRHTSVPAGEIILSSGYQNNNVFYALFREKVGMTPGQYRNAGSADSDP